MKKIYVSGDHAGFKLKAKLKPFLEKLGFKVEDIGPHEYNKDDDYPDFVIPMAKKVVKGGANVGIIVAGSGQGEAIAVNKVKGIRAGLYHGGSTSIVKVGREHDNINVLCFGSKFVTEVEARGAIKIFIKTKFEKGRHLRRLKKISKKTIG